MFSDGTKQRPSIQTKRFPIFLFSCLFSQLLSQCTVKNIYIIILILKGEKERMRKIKPSQVDYKRDDYTIKVMTLLFQEPESYI